MNAELENIKSAYVKRLNNTCNKREWVISDLNYPINSCCYSIFDDNDESYDASSDQDYSDGMCNGNCNDGRKYKHPLSFSCIFAPSTKINKMCINCENIIKEFQLEYIRCQLDQLIIDKKNGKDINLDHINDITTNNKL